MTSDAKALARQRFRGVENLLLPSFTPDFTALDAEGIAHDVRHAARHGFFASSCATPGLTLEETKAFLSIAVEAADGRLIGAILERPTLEENREVLLHAERAGCSHAFVVLPRTVRPGSVAELLEWYARLLDDTRIPVVLYGHHNPSLVHLHPSGLLLDAYDRLADRPQVVGIKLTQPISPVSALEVAARLGDRLVVNPVNLELVPLLARSTPLAMTGQWIVESVQSPGVPWVVEFMALIAAGREAEACALYWRFAPAVRAIFELQAPLVAQGLHPWAHMKFMQWCAGGNGGLVREAPGGKPVPPLDAAARQAIRATREAVGLEDAQEGEDGFLTGRAAHARGVRPGDLAARPGWAG